MTELKPQYEVLLAKAISDLHMARLAMLHPDKDIDDATIVFHLQQSAEKLLKTMLAFEGVHFEKVHDLVLLVDQCRECGINLPEYTDRFSRLNPFAVIGRYGLISSGEFDLVEWLEIITEFKVFVETTIKTPNQ